MVITMKQNASLSLSKMSRADIETMLNEKSDQIERRLTDDIERCPKLCYALERDAQLDKHTDSIATHAIW